MPNVALAKYLKCNRRMNFNARVPARIWALQAIGRGTDLSASRTAPHMSSADWWLRSLFLGVRLGLWFAHTGECREKRDETRW